MSTPQEYWDACLIRAWRNFNSLKELNTMFHSITGQWPEKVEPRLLRKPKGFLVNTMGVRYYVAHFLPKINDRLLAQDKDKDVALLRKLKDSKYDTQDDYILSVDERERHNMGTHNRLAKQVNAHNAKAIASRNEATDWNKVKGPVKSGRAR